MTRSLHLLWNAPPSEVLQTVLVLGLLFAVAAVVLEIIRRLNGWSPEAKPKPQGLTYLQRLKRSGIILDVWLAVMVAMLPILARY